MTEKEKRIHNTTCEERFVETCRKIALGDKNPDLEDDLVLGYQELMCENPKKFRNCVTYKDVYLTIIKKED